MNVDFPHITYIGSGGPQSEDQTAFYNCPGLRNISFGTAHTTPTNISFGYAVFSTGMTNDIDLTLGEFVLPAPNLNAKT